MKRAVVFAFLMFLAGFPAQDGWAFDLGEGFLGMNWKTKIGDLPALSKLYSNEKVDFYVKKGEMHKINEVEIPDVIYGFYSNELFAVYITIDDINVYDDMRRYMKSKYGNPAKEQSTKKDETVYKWKYKNVRIKLKSRENEGKMKVAFYYTPISRVVNEAEQERFNSESFKFLPIHKDKKPTALPLLEF